MPISNHSAAPDEPAPTGARSGANRRHGKPVPEWQQHLQELPVYTPDVQLRRADRSLYAAASAKARKAGASTTAIAAFLGCSVGLVQRLLESVGVLDDSYDVRCAETILRNRISTGTYQVGDALPAVKELWKELDVPFDSVLRALARLEGKGIVLRFQNRGYVVTDPDAPPTGLSMQVRTQTGKVATWPLPGTKSHIRGIVTARIKDGTYPIGSRIPGNRALAKEFGITEKQVSYLLRSLRAQGLTTTEGPGPRGTFVHPSARNRLMSAESGGTNATVPP